MAPAVSAHPERSNCARLSPSRTTVSTVTQPIKGRRAHQLVRERRAPPVEVQIRGQYRCAPAGVQRSGVMEVLVLCESAWVQFEVVDGKEVDPGQLLSRIVCIDRASGVQLPPPVGVTNRTSWPARSAQWRASRVPKGTCSVPVGRRWRPAHARLHESGHRREVGHQGVVNRNAAEEVESFIGPGAWPPCAAQALCERRCSRRDDLVLMEHRQEVGIRNLRLDCLAIAGLERTAMPSRRRCRAWVQVGAWDS